MKRLGPAVVVALGAQLAAAAPRRPPPPPLPKDARPIDHGEINRLLNGRDPQRGWIYASPDGGCHVYPADGKPRPPGSFPPPTPVDCPPEMLAVEWGWCTGAGNVLANDRGDQCICAPGQGDPPAPAFRMPCPGTHGPDARPKAIADLVAANHILADQGVLDGYGHVSVRDPVEPDHYLMARSVAPELVGAADVVVHDLDGNAAAPASVGLYLERFIHGEIYRLRPDVKAIVHCHAPSLIPFGVTGVPLRPVYHMSAFLAGGVPVFDIRKATGGASDMLIRTPALGRALAQALGPHAVALMRGHGAVIVGRDVQQAVFRAVYTEVNARLQAEALALGKKVIYLDDGEARKVEERLDATRGRPWELWLRRVEEK